MQMKKILSLLLALLLLLTTVTTLLSCADDTQGDTEPPEDNTPEQPDDETPGEEEKPEKLLPNLPDIAFGGEEFHCLHWTLDSGVGGGWVPWEEIAVAEPTGDLLVDQVYQRNAYVEEKYDVTVTTEYCMAHTEMAPKIRNAVATDDKSFQMMVQRSANLTGMWTEELFHDLGGDEMHHIDLTRPWWNQDSVNVFTLGGNTQFASSEMLLLDKSETGCVFFSSVLQADHSLDNFYDLVNEGTWTWEALLSNASVCVDDLNGDDTMDANDLWGSAGNRAPGAYLYCGSGYSFAELDEDGYMISNFGDEESISLMVELHENMIYADSHAHSDYIKDFSIKKKFESNEVLFIYYSVKMSNNLRDMETNYGILPIPKYDEYQEDYHCLIMPDGDSVIGVPLSCGNTEMVSLVIEALSAESYYTVYPAFYDVVLMSKFTRDTQSKDMLKIVFDSRTYDLGAIYGLGGFYGQLVTHAATKRDSNIASLYASMESTLNSSLQTINDLIDKWSES